MATDIEVTKFKRCMSPFRPSMPCWSATVETGGLILGFTRYDDEGEWYCDSSVHKASNAMQFVHGIGNRTFDKRIAAGELKGAIDERLVIENTKRAN